MKQAEEDAARKERKEIAASLIGTPGWLAIQEEIKSRIAQLSRILMTTDFKDLQQVKAIQTEIATLQKVFDFPINESK